MKFKNTHSTTAASASNRPSVLVVSRWLGVPSEVWLWRQIVGFKSFAPEILTWRYDNPNLFPVDCERLHIMSTVEEPNDASARWKWRARNLLTRNFFGTQGQEQSALTDIIRGICPAVILCHFGHVGLRLLPVAKSLNIPIVVHFHGQDISSGLNNRWYRWSLKNSIAEFNATVCVGSHQRRRLINLGAPESSSYLIPCGVPTSQFQPKESLPSELAHADQTVIRFICVARLVHCKGVHVAIEAFSLLVATGFHARLIIVGDGPASQALKDLTIRLGIETFVDFAGVRTPSEIISLLAHSDIFLQHSLTDANGWDEGFGVSIAEAAAMSLPVIVSNCGGITDQVINGETGLVINENDIVGMFKAMHALGSNGELQLKLGSAGRQRMIDQFDFSTKLAELENVLIHVCNTK